MTDAIKYQCTLCGHEVTPTHGETALWSRGYWWCIKHARIGVHEGQRYVDFPSVGKLIPETIMITED
jgi:hypothetical protein